jgi:inositol phosphorylceramide mannosyltransferase catalytic subunit
MLINLFRFYRSSPRFLIIALLVIGVNLWYFRTGIQSAWTIVNLPFVWNRHASDFLISKEHDDFDLTFANYSLSMDSSQPTYPDLVPPVLHHIALGHNKPHKEWVEARQACLEYHEGWEEHLWTDENASEFVLEYFPQFKHTWDKYKYPIQRIDALRYMVLYEYGGMYSLLTQIGHSTG